MLLGLVPGLLTFFIRIFVPESEKWEREHQKGSTSNWSSYDLLAVIAGTAMSLIMITLWRVGPEVLGQQVVLIRAVGTIVCLAGAALGFLYPSLRFCRAASQHEHFHRRVLETRCRRQATFRMERSSAGCFLARS